MPWQTAACEAPLYEGEPTDEYYDSIIRWHETRNGVTGLTKECIGYENGVLGGVLSALTSYAAPGDYVFNGEWV